jgi:hypothetical protein
VSLGQLVPEVERPRDDVKLPNRTGRFAEKSRDVEDQ